MIIKYKVPRDKNNKIYARLLLRKVKILLKSTKGDLNNEERDDIPD